TALTLYFDEISRYERLTRDEQATLSREIRENENLDARNKLVEHNLQLVIRIAKRYRGLGMDFADLIQEGNLGLMTAADRYDASRGTAFSTCAEQWIRQAIRRALTNKAHTIRLPSHMMEMVQTLERCRKQLIETLGRDPTLEELSEKLGLSAPKTKKVLRAAELLSIPSLDEPTHLSDYKEDELVARYGIIESKKIMAPLQVMEAKEELEACLETLRQFLKALSAVEHGND